MHPDKFLEIILIALMCVTIITPILLVISTTIAIYFALTAANVIIVASIIQGYLLTRWFDE